MKKVIIVGLSLLAFVIFGAGCQLGAQPTATPDLQAEYVPVVSVTGEMVPATWAALSSKAGGTVAEVLVEAGDAVVAGAPLVRLDTTDLNLSLQVAEQEVAVQQAVLDQMIAGATERVIARADRENAREIAQAEIALRVKEQKLEQARAQDPAKDVTAARARIRQLELQLTQARAQNPSPEVEVAQVELERAKIALDDTQDEYSKALDRPWEDQGIRDAWAKQLEQAQLDYRSAQAQLDLALSARRAHTVSLDALAAQIEEAQARLEQTIEAQSAYSVTLVILETEVEAAQLRIDQLRAWENPHRDEATDEEIAQAEARLQQAKWTIAQIRQQIEDAEVRAPFEGTVGAVSVRVGELVSSGQSMVTLGDLDTLRVETTDLDEIDVVRVSIDQEVAITFDALPDRVFPGRVTRIAPMAEPGTGGVHYTVIIELEEMDPTLRWGMTAFVDIEVGK
jgi:multidrug efflux pump subunit AcrA (membrane-fusion protein)